MTNTTRSTFLFHLKNKTINFFFNDRYFLATVRISLFSSTKNLFDAWSTHQSPHLTRCCSWTEFVPYRTFSASSGTNLLVESFGLRLGIQEQQSFGICRYELPVRFLNLAVRHLYIFVKNFFHISNFPLFTDVRGFSVLQAEMFHLEFIPSPKLSRTMRTVIT